MSYSIYTPNPLFCMDRIGATVEEFRQLRRQADRRRWWAFGRRLRQLLSFRDVPRQLGVSGMRNGGLQEIPINTIVGSVNRTQDFTADFLPKLDHSQERWVRIKTAMEKALALPPIAVYQVGAVYFVIDGHHRISVARRMGISKMAAYVTQVFTRTPLIIEQEISYEQSIGASLFHPMAARTH